MVTANELRKRLGRDHRIVLVDREETHVFWPSLLWLQVGLRKPEKIVRNLTSLERKGVEVIKGEVERIDPEGKVIEVNGRDLKADYLVLALGAQLAPELVPGLAEAGHDLYSLEGATTIRDARRSLTEGTLVVLVARTPFKCPAAPYEAAMLLERDLHKRKVRSNVDIAIYSPEPGPMGVTGPEVSAGVRQLVEDRGIAYYPQHQITGVDNGTRTLKFANGAKADFNFLVYVPPHIVPGVMKGSGLVGESGWVTVNPSTMETDFPDVYAIGDVTGIPLSIGLPLPKAGVFAHRQGEAVARTIAAEVTGKGRGGTFDGQGECFIEVGGGKAGFGRGNFYAEPTPEIKLHKPTRYWHGAKILFEKDWFRRWF